MLTCKVMLHTHTHTVKQAVVCYLLSSLLLSVLLTSYAFHSVSLLPPLPPLFSTPRLASSAIPPVSCMHSLPLLLHRISMLSLSLSLLSCSYHAPLTSHLFSSLVCSFFRLCVLSFSFSSLSLISPSLTCHRPPSASRIPRPTTSTSNRSVRPVRFARPPVPLFSTSPQRTHNPQPNKQSAMRQLVDQV